MSWRTALIGLLFVLTVGRAGVAAGQPLVTGFVDPAMPGMDEPDPPRAYALIRRAGATLVRVPVSWSALAPARPANQADPRDAAYSWAALDARVTQAVAKGLRPILVLYAPPAWAVETPGQGTYGHWPQRVALQRFAEAIARRYDGHSGLPRVHHWQVWNEPNLEGTLRQRGTGIIGHYRAMVNAVADAVKRVSPDNLVLAGGLAPFGGPGPFGSERGGYGTRPLAFMRRLLCLSAGGRPRVVCRRPVRFDIWAHHPYTSGGPTHEALQPGDVSIGDLGEMKRVLDAARRSGTIRSSGRVRFWVTEFSWDTNPPDPGGVPPGLHARWVAEGLYRMWRSGVSRVIWFQLRDLPTSSSHWQSGLYFADGSSKPALRAFRFPFVAFSRGRSIAVWGRTPGQDARAVVIEQRRSGRWRRIGRERSDGDGIFIGKLRSVGSGPVRARISEPAGVARPFSLSRPRDRFFNPFGTAPRAEG